MSLYAIGALAISAIILGSPSVSFAAYGPLKLTIPSQLPQATQGKPYSYSFASRVSGGTGPPYIWRMTGALPSGLKFGIAKALLSGTVSKNAKISTYTLRVCATGGKRAVSGSTPDNYACVSTRIAVVRGTRNPTPTPSAALRITTTTLPGVVSRQNYRATIAIAGLRGNLNCALEQGSVLPTGYLLNANTCTITGQGAVLNSGTTKTVSLPFTVRARDSAVPTALARATFTITTYAIGPVIALIPVICVIGVPCNPGIIAAANGGFLPYYFLSDQFAGGLPPLGMHLDVNGRLTGTPTALGIHTMGICATDVVGLEACGTTTVTVVPAGPFVVTVNRDGDGQGSIAANSGTINCGPTCQGNYVAGAQVTLTATAANGSVFTGWAGACAGTGNCVLNVNANLNATATFRTSASGTYGGNINFPNINPAGVTGCEAQVLYRSITLNEALTGAITGGTNNPNISIKSGNRVGNTINVTLKTAWGDRGPYVWQWNVNTLSGVLPAICSDNSTGALLSESTYAFSLQRN
ncbi:MAG: putative Ig domain-containing protein [Candidatus Nanopelagicaceae bacterium]